MIFAAYEDRPHFAVGLKLLVASLSRCSPQVPLHVVGVRDEAVRRWIGRFPQVVLVDASFRLAGYNVKPALLLHLLEQHDDVVWIDSDIVATGDIGARMTGLPRDTISVAQETAWARPVSPTARTEGWKLPVGRPMTIPVNSGVVRVTRAHRDLLRAWDEALASDFYKRAQKAAWDDRPTGTLGDQDVLEALLGSQRFASIPIDYLKRGSEIIQYFGATGYSLRERIEHLTSGGPLLVHSMGRKLWEYPPGKPKVGDGMAYYERVWQDVSPYAFAASRFAPEIDEPTPWIAPRTLPGRLMRMTAFGSLPLHGLPQAAADGLIRGTKRRLDRVLRAVRG